MTSWFGKVFGRRGKPPRSVADEHSPECRELRRSASDYIDGDSPEPLSARIQRHLGLCRECDSWVNSLRRTVGLLRGMPKKEAPESLKASIRDMTRH